MLTKKNMIPEMSDEAIAERLKALACVHVDAQGLWWAVDLEGVDPRNIAFLWDLSECLSPIEPMGCPTDSFNAIHTYGAPSFFKPSIYEVLTQMPDGFYNDEPVRAFALSGQELDSGSFLSIAGGHYHFAKWDVWDVAPTPLEAPLPRSFS